MADMKCKFEHDGDCCNSGATQYMCKCKKPCYEIIPMTNGDRIRAMTDKELASFLSERYAKESVLRVRAQGYEPTATQIKALHEGLYLAWIRWLEQYAEVE